MASWLNRTPRFNKNSGQLLLLLGLAVFLYVFIVNAWLADDAFITLRIVDNFVNGFGLRWNVAERVQVGTSPLWTLVISFFYFFTREPFFTTLAVSLVINLLLLLVVYRFFKEYFTENFFWGYLLFLLLLISSKSFMDYTSSGLENSLGHLILGLFYCLFLFRKEDYSQAKDRDIFTIFLIAALGFLTRQDYLLILGLPILFVFIQYYQKPTWRKTAVIWAGLMPAVAWMAFSIIYFGFPFPNTLYAKLNILSEMRWTIQRYGNGYFLNSLAWDPLTLVLIFLAILGALFLGTTRERLTAAGITLYLLYIRLVGGDFMSGRFFSGVFLIGVLLLIKNSRKKTFLITAFFALAVYQICWTYSPIKNNQRSRPIKSVYHVNDEKGIYFQEFGLICRIRRRAKPIKPSQPWLYDYKEQLGLQDIKEQLHNNFRVIFHGKVGYLGFLLGPEYYIIDGLGLGNVLLARIPGRPIFGFAGHVVRYPPPQGYIDSVGKSANLLGDPDLKLFYDKLLPIIRGPLFRWERFKNIYEMNTGRYDYLINKYLENNRSGRK